MCGTALRTSDGLTSVHSTYYDSIIIITGCFEIQHSCNVILTMLQRHSMWGEYVLLHPTACLRSGCYVPTERRIIKPIALELRAITTLNLHLESTSYVTSVGVNNLVSIVNIASIDTRDIKLYHVVLYRSRPLVLLLFS